MSVLTPVVDSWDGANRRIYLKSGVSDYFPIDDIYTEYRNARRTDETFRVWDALLRAEGNVPKGAGAFTPRYVVLLDGTKIIPFDEVLQVNQLGDMITDDPDVDPSLYDVSTLTVPKVIYIKPSEAETIQLNSEAIVYSSFQGMVWIDTSSPYSDKGSSTEPNGNAERPVNNLTIGYEIALERGFKVIKFRSDYVVTESLDLTGMTLIGESHVYIDITIQGAANVTDVTIKECIIDGIMDGNTSLRNCVVKNISYVNGHIHSCSLNGLIILDNSQDSYIEGCRQLSMNVTPQISMGTSGQNLSMPDYIGLLEVYDLNSSTNSLGIGLNGGRVILDTTTISAGFVHVSGSGVLLDELGNRIYTGMWNTNVMVINELSDPVANANAVWTSILTGATFNLPTSAGRRLRDISSQVITTGTAVSSTVNTIVLDGDASTVDGAYDPAGISIVNGTGIGQSRLILEYTGATKKAVVDRDWKINPDATSEYVITANAGREHVNEGQAQAGTLTTMTLNSLASSIDNTYRGHVLFIRSGTGEDQARRVISYDGTTKIAIMEKPFAVAPDNTSGYVMLPTSILLASGIASEVWAAILTSNKIVGSFGEAIGLVWDEVGGDRTIDPITFQEIFYKAGGVEVMRFNLFDENDNPSVENVHKRVRV